jgi:hypothetical protein
MAFIGSLRTFGLAGGTAMYDVTALRFVCISQVAALCLPGRRLSGSVVDQLQIGASSLLSWWQGAGNRNGLTPPPLKSLGRTCSLTSWH